MSFKSKRILFCVSGSISAYKSAYVISKLAQAGHEVQVVATAGALEFVGASTLEGLSGRPLFLDIHAPGRRMEHIELARWADLAILCPASANTINRLSAGLADDPIGALFLAWELDAKPWMIAPAMNHRMLAHPATRRSLATLKSYGVRLLDTDVGVQACGETGPGRLLEPARLIEEIALVLEKLP